MKNFADYTVEDFASEPLFVKWVQHPEDSELGSFWDYYLLENPRQVENVETARQIVSEVSSQYTGLPKPEVDTLWGRIRRSVRRTDASPSFLPKSETQNMQIGTFALLLLAIVVVALLWQIFA